MGGQGGGVLADWIVDLAEHAGYYAQSTSVPGVAQRTGATVYYLELFPRAEAPVAPVFALMPVAGDVDVVIAGELLEAGRAILRGFVTSDRTVLIASSHRDYALAEKAVPGDGRVNAEAILAAARNAARRVICFDMESLAQRSAAAISAVVFGALAAAGVLPFTRAQFEAAVRRAEIAVETNLAGFASGYEGCAQQTGAMEGKPAHVAKSTAVAQPLQARIDAEFPAQIRDIVALGVARLVDYQDLRYAAEYLERLAPIVAADRSEQHALSAQTARGLALWMSYEDTIRVADLKTRATRFSRVRTEVDAAPDAIVHITEFMHPRVEEIAGTLPAALGTLVLEVSWLRACIAIFCRRGRRIRTTSISGFLLLYVIAGLRRWRRASLRHRVEHARIDAWLAAIHAVAPVDPALATQIAACQQLVKGYGDTHERGWRKYQRVTAQALRLHGRPGAAQRVRELISAALLDEDGQALDAALAAQQASNA